MDKKVNQETIIVRTFTLIALSKHLKFELNIKLIIRSLANYRALE